MAFLGLAGLTAAAENLADLPPVPRPEPETELNPSGNAEPSHAGLPPGFDGRDAFDRAAALAAEGRTAEARDLLAAVSQSGDLQLAALAHYNLGCLAASEARQLFGAAPDQLPARQREEGLDLLAQACEHFRQCLRRQPEHADARYNLELIRLWIGSNRTLWQSQAQIQADEPAGQNPGATPAAKSRPKTGDLQGSQAAQKPASPPEGVPGQAAQTPKAKAPAGHGSDQSTKPVDPLRQYAEDLMAKVRQRIHERRQREQSRLLPRWSQAAEKDW